VARLLYVVEHLAHMPDSFQDAKQLLTVLNLAVKEPRFLLGIFDCLAGCLGGFGLAHNVVCNRLRPDDIFLECLGILLPGADLLLGFLIYRVNFGLME
jgi:hypothetical protein